MSTPPSLPLGRKLKQVSRLAQIAQCFAKHGFWSFLEQAKVGQFLSKDVRAKIEDLHEQQDRHSEQATNPDKDIHSSSESGWRSRALAHRLRVCFEELGPAFVKLGQFMSLRRDLLPETLIGELANLQQNVQPVSFDLMEATLKETLGESLEDFEHIDPTPLAAGSIGQVHQARLKDGSKVVLKIRRPGIEKSIQVDLSIMEDLAKLLESSFSELRNFRPTATVAEFSQSLLGELDFIREAGHTAKIKKHSERFGFVVIPDIYWQYTRPRVLTMSFLAGIPFTRTHMITERKLDPAALLKNGMSAFLQSVFVDGLFHGDLHPGNLLATDDERIGLLDFGIVGRMNRTTRMHLALLFVALVEEDYEALATHFRELSRPGPRFDQRAFEHDVAQRIAPYVGLKLHHLDSGQLLWHLAQLSADHDAPIPRELVLFLKSLVMLEGIGRDLDPELDILGICEEVARDLAQDLYHPDQLKYFGLSIARDSLSLLRTAPFQIRQLLEKAIAGEAKLQIEVKDLNRIARSLHQSSSRIAVAMICAALIIASAILTHADSMQALPLLGSIGFLTAGIVSLYVIWSIFRSGRL